jgi:hypothetical protein
MYLLLGSRGQFQTKIDEQDYPIISRWRWQWKKSVGGYKVYAKRTARIAGKKKTILLSHFILEVCKNQPRPSLDHDADHRNGNSLDDTRGNLRWLHKSINRRRRY